MARNLKPSYLRKLIDTKTPNGYKFDLANYVYNPSCEHEYPTFRKMISEDETSETFEEVGYYKHYDGTGEYIRRKYSIPKEDGSWHITKRISETVIATANRFSINALVSYC